MKIYNWVGPAYKGAMRDARADKRREAEARQAAYDAAHSVPLPAAQPLSGPKADIPATPTPLKKTQTRRHRRAHKKGGGDARKTKPE